jgi:hypothetical protein
VKVARRDTARRVTPQIIDFHIQRAHELRAEAYRNIGRALWALLVKLTRLLP